MERYGETLNLNLMAKRHFTLDQQNARMKLAKVIRKNRLNMNLHLKNIKRVEKFLYIDRGNLPC